MMAATGFGLVLFPFTEFAEVSVAKLTPVFVATSVFLIGYYFFYKGIYETDASSFAPLFQLQAGLIALLAYVFLGERFPLSSYLWVGLMILGALLVTVDEKMKIQAFFKRGIWFIVLMQVLHAISNLFIGFSLKNLDFVTVLFWESVFIGGLLVLFLWWKKPRLDYGRKQVFPVLLATWLATFGALMLFRAFSVNLTVTSAISLLNAPLVFVVSVVASRFYPKLLEHHTAKVYLIRGAGLVAILVAALNIAVS